LVRVAVLGKLSYFQGYMFGTQKNLGRESESLEIK
jgi:hypothetical protein